MEFATLHFKILFLNSNSSESLLPHLPPPSACFFRPSVMALDISGLSACSFTFPFTPVTLSLPTIPPNTIWSSAALLMEDGSCEEGGGPESGSSWSLEPVRREMKEEGERRRRGKMGGKGRGREGERGRMVGKGKGEEREGSRGEGSHSQFYVRTACT